MTFTHETVKAHGPHGRTTAAAAVTAHAALRRASECASQNSPSRPVRVHIKLHRCITCAPCVHVRVPVLSTTPLHEPGGAAAPADASRSWRSTAGG
eukprot:778787-Prymnesium_polylepis.1